MSLWKLGAFTILGARRASKEFGDNLAAGARSRQAQAVPRRVVKRGYLVPGDPTPPPGLDLRDYRGLEPRPFETSIGADPVILGRSIDLGSGMPGPAVRLPLRRFLQHTAVIAPPGKGKTEGVIVPWSVRLLRAGASVVALDVTGALGQKLKEYARQTANAGTVAVRSISWTLHPGQPSMSWNPLAGVDPNDSLAIEGLKSAIAGDEPPDPRHRDFHDRDLRYLGALLRMTIMGSSEPTLAAVAGLFDDEASFRQLARIAGVRSVTWEELRDCWSLRNKLDPFADGIARDRTSRSDFAIEAITEQHTMATVGAELELKSLSRAAAALFVNRLVAALQARYSAASPRPVILVIDEAPEVARRIDLARVLATARATGTGIVLACQNVTQLGNDDEQSTILDSCDTMLLLRDPSDASIKRFQARLGQRERSRMSHGTDLRHRQRVSSVEHTSESVEVIGARELLDPPFGRFPAFVHARSMSPRPFVLELDRSAELS